jgi:hypothetical protein
LNKLFRFIENVSLAVLANSIYAFAHGDESKINIYILIASLYIMFASILLQEDI